MAIVKEKKVKRASPRRSCREVRFRSTNFSATKAGFTLIELLVVIGIFAIVASVLLFNFSGFNDGVALTNLSEEIGLSIRQAQSYATSVHSLAGTNNTLSDTFPAYGISFSVTPSTAADAPNPTAFALFADVSPDGLGDTNDLYDNNGTCGTPAQGAECLNVFGIQNGDSITALCYAQTVNTAATCLKSSGTVNVVFRRPSPDAEICVAGDDCTGTTPQLQSYLYITVTSPKGTSRTIKIYNTGQISIE